MALLAQPHDSEMRQIGFKPVTLSDLAGQRRDDGQIELDLHSAAFAHEVLVPRVFRSMPLRDPGVEMDVLDQPFLLQQLHRSVDRRQVDLRKPRVHAAVDVFDRDVSRDRLERVQDDLALEREAVASIPQGGAQLSHVPVAPSPELPLR